MPKGIYFRETGKRVAIGNYHPKCMYPGCNNLAMKVHKRSYFQKYQPLYRNSKKTRAKKLEGYYCNKYCIYHHRKKYKITMWRQEERLRNLLSGNPCQVCGWNKANCDLHRIIPGNKGGKYTEDNIIVLCPNCHRLVHRGLLKI